MVEEKPLARFALPRYTLGKRMDSALTWPVAIFLGALQGVAEFLPISSSGHLSLAQALVQLDPESGGHTLNVVVHAGTLLAVLWVYRKDLQNLVASLFHPERDPDGRPSIVALIIGCLPLFFALLPGVKDFVIQMEGNIAAVGFALWFTALLLAFSHRRSPPVDPERLAPSYLAALLIGIAQVFAIMPGVSRSGATIAAALALGLGRARAARFSFLLSIPAITAATLLEFKDVIGGQDAQLEVPIGPLLAAFVTSCVVGLISLRALLRLLKRFGLLPFVPYLVIVGGIAIALSR